LRTIYDKGEKLPMAGCCVTSYCHDYKLPGPADNWITQTAAGKGIQLE
jgi:hypothetical protein